MSIDISNIVNEIMQMNHDRYIIISIDKSIWPNQMNTYYGFFDDYDEACICIDYLHRLFESIYALFQL